jgi:hypothetical protein
MDYKEKYLKYKKKYLILKNQLGGLNCKAFDNNPDLCKKDKSCVWEPTKSRCDDKPDAVCKGNQPECRKLKECKWDTSIRTGVLGCMPKTVQTVKERDEAYAKMVKEHEKFTRPNSSNTRR